MPRIDLNGTWTLHYGPQRKAAAKCDSPEIPPEWPAIEAAVPGNVELDLIRAGQLPGDLDRGHNIYLLRELEVNQWWFERTFRIDEPADAAGWTLVFEGLDTLATVWVNGRKVASLENMLIPHRLDVSDIVRPGENRIVVGIDSVVLAARETPVDPGTFAMENNWESLSIRKAAHMFGWDIMPRVLSAGMWRGVYLESVPDTAFRDLYLHTMAVDPAGGAATLVVCWGLKGGPVLPDGCTVRLTVTETADAGRVVYEKGFPVLGPHGVILAELAEVELWWPRGQGRAALYKVSLSFIDASGREQACWNTRYGFRTVRLERSEVTDADGNGRFAFVVNGREVFIKGTNWVPLDALHSRDAERLEETFAMLTDLGCNMVRCWGGNVYEADAFFNLCDEAGILVWQDFALACALYPQTPALHQKIRAEAEAIIPRLRNHPCLALWAGNNEIDAFYTFAKPFSDPNVDDEISRNILAAACRRLDPGRDYLPSSPYFGPELWALGAPHDRRPEDHLWGPRDDFKGEYYRSSNAHFVSEIGYHGCPARSSLERMMTPENLWPWQDNEEWLTHAVRPQRDGTAYNYRIALMANQIRVLFGRVPDDLDAFILASQISQAEALKFFVERFRIHRGRRSGILWWNLRDGWPQISDGVVDYYGAKKAAYGVIRRVQQEVCVMLDEPSEGWQAVIAVNDSPRAENLVTSVSCEESELFAGRAEIPSHSALKLGDIPAAGEREFRVIEWQAAGSVGENHYLAGPRPFDVEETIRWYRQAKLLGAVE